ncbi:MAG TPA: alpha/beta fold hydrolase [Chroococcales cyanobacterium]
MSKDVSKAVSRKVQANRFVSLLKAGDFASANSMLDERMKASLTGSGHELKSVWEQLTAKAGPFQAIVDTRVEHLPADYEKDIVACRFQYFVLDLHLAFDPTGKIAGFFVHPHSGGAVEPAYARKESYAEVPVKVGSGEFALDGTLTVPSGSGPFPAVVLVHGSGSNDRDETVMALKPFRDLAWGLASKGIAVLRYDKRTHQHARELMKNEQSITIKEETIDDAGYAVQALLKQPKIDSRHVFVLGHSLGGMLIPKIAEVTPEAAGYVIMAGTTRPLEDVMLDQIEYLTSLKANPTADDTRAVEEMRKKVAAVKNPALAEGTPREELPMGTSAKYWLALRGYDPAAAAKNVQKPMLILQGESDYQVTMKDYDGWKKALSDRADVTFKLYPGLSHCFVKAGAKPSPQDYEKPQNVSDQVISDLAGWIKSISSTESKN